VLYISSITAYSDIASPLLHGAYSFITWPPSIVPGVIPYSLAVQRSVDAALERRAVEVVGPRKRTMAERHSQGEAESWGVGKGEEHERVGGEVKEV